MGREPKTGQAGNSGTAAARPGGITKFAAAPLIAIALGLALGAFSAGKGIGDALAEKVAPLAQSEKQKRSAAAVRDFKRQNPCPANGHTAGSCPGWIVDHIVPLCAGGADAPANMQWQTIAQAKEKDKGEWKQCRAMKKGTRT